MSAIEINGLTVYACHGVLAEEKIKEQPFVFYIKMETDFYLAAKEDDLGGTVDYAEVCKFVNNYCRSNAFSLIEKLAYGTAFGLCEKFPAISAISVTVEKPQAPVGLPFDGVSVQCSLKREKVLLSLGSSCGDRKAYLERAIAMLENVRGVSVCKLSSIIETEPYGGVAKNKFLNCAVQIECLLSPRELLYELHMIEQACGRVRAERWGDRTLDIDIIFFGSRIIAEEGLIIPHADYTNREFVLAPLKEIAPDFVCPVLSKKLSEL